MPMSKPKKLKNYTTKVSATQSINEIQEELVRHGATGILFEYEQGNGRIAALKFMLTVNGKKAAFTLPVEWRDFQKVLQNQGVKRCNDDDYVYRVAWRILRDWVSAQMAIFDAKNVPIPQLLLGFGMFSERKTLYEEIQHRGGYLLGSGED